MHLNKFLALVYSDIFDFPLTQKELALWSVSNKACGIKGKSVPKSRVSYSRGFYVISGRERLIGLRKKREEITLKKESLAKKYADLLSKIVFVEAIYLTGSVAVGNAKKEADIDLLIMVSPNSLWISRLIIVSILKLMRIYRDKDSINNRVCTNLYLDVNNLEAKEKNLFTAHEILQAKCLFDRNNIQYRWLKINSWVEKYLPIVYRSSLRGSLQKRAEAIREYRLPRSTRSLAMTFLFPIELFAYLLQFAYQKPKQTNEKIGWGYAYFHPNNLSDSVLERFNRQIDG